MKLTRSLTPAVVALAITMAAGPALAQSGGNDRERRPRDRSPRATDSGSRARGTGGAQSSGDVAVRRTESRADAGRANIGQDGGRPSGNRRSDAGQSSSRSYDSRRNDNGRVNSQRYDDRRYDNGRYDSRRYGAYTGSDRYAWRSRIHVGLGISIFAGRPFAFRFDYGWRPRFTYHYSMRPGVAYGGMSFLLNPDYAEVYIDGEFAGIARDFGGQPVPVAMGYHRIELYAQGFEPVAFDINVLPGRVIPYRGSLYRVY